MRASRTPKEIIVVWDFDGDTTRPVVERLVAELPGLRGHRNDLGRGVLNAMRAGIATARGSLVLISMADGSDEPGVVDPMVALARGGAAVVSASRYMRGGRQVGGPPLKRLLSRTAGLTLHWFGGVATHDPTNNFKLYRRDFLDSVSIESKAGFELALELTVKATLAGRRVGRGPHDLAGQDRRREPLPPAPVAAALPPLVHGGAQGSAQATPGALSDPSRPPRRPHSVAPSADGHRDRPRDPQRAGHRDQRPGPAGRRHRPRAGSG